MMRENFVICFIILIFILSFSATISFAQQIPFSPRENIIFATLNKLQEREEAIRDAMKEAQMKFIEGGFFVEEKVRAFSLKDIAKRSHPYLTLKTTSDDNVNEQPDKKSSLINTITPGLKTNFTGRGKSLRLDTFIDNTYYNNRSQSNSQGSTLDILSNLSIGRYSLSLADNVFTNRISSHELGVKMSQIEYYWKNTFNSILGRYFNRIGFNLGYGRTDYNYESDFDLTRDRTEETFTFNQYLRVATKTQVLLEYTHGRTKYVHKPLPSKDYNYNDYNLIVTGVLSSKITSLAKVGYKVADYKHSKLADLQEDDDYRNLTLTGNLGYKVSDRSDLALTLKRVIHKEISNREDYYIEDDFNLSGNHRLAFNPKFKLSFSYEAKLRDYKEKISSDNEKNTYTLNFGLSYAFRRWLDFSLDYTRKKTASNVDDDYLRNIITFKTQARF